MLKYLLSIVTLAISTVLQAQVEMADGFRSEGKIYIVIAIILVILGGFFFLLFKLDNRTKRLEKKVGERNQ